MVEVEEFMQLARSRCQVPDESLVLPMAERYPGWSSTERPERWTNEIWQI